jgi:hypothetical protein
MSEERAYGGVRIAMWSGPRNISTAMLRSWGNRDDTFVCLDLCAVNGIDRGIEDLSTTDMYNADEMFLTGTMGSWRRS